MSAATTTPAAAGQAPPAGGIYTATAGNLARVAGIAGLVIAVSSLLERRQRKT